jgi:hypothetical protein
LTRATGIFLGLGDVFLEPIVGSSSPEEISGLSLYRVLAECSGRESPDDIFG